MLGTRRPRVVRLDLWGWVTKMRKALATKCKPLNQYVLYAPKIANYCSVYASQFEAVVMAFNACLKDAKQMSLAQGVKDAIELVTDEGAPLDIRDVTSEGE